MAISAGELFDPAFFICTGILLNGFSGVAGIFLRNRAALGQKIAMALSLAGSLGGFAGALAILLSGATGTFFINWSLPFDPCMLGIDPLTSLFLLPVFLISGCAAVYAAGYWPASHNPGSSRSLCFFIGVLAAAMALVVMARNGILFLMVWEVMAISAYFAITAESGNAEVRRAGLTYLICTHLGTLALFVMFIRLRSMTGSFLLPSAATLDPLAPGAMLLFFTALFGFGIKAGLMPFHIWLPAAHANGPSHVSAMMSGVMLKMGIYGIIRLLTLFSAIPLWWGIILLGLGIISGVAGVVTAVGQNDIKRLLAYSSIENIGIITMGIGTAVIGRAIGNEVLVLLGMGGALLHILNHSLFKSLLFFGSGAVIHATGTRELNRMGGLARRMPHTALLFVIASLAICGLPPLNGFVSEFLLYVGFFTGVKDSPVSILLLMGCAVTALAMIGALAVSCFVKLYGIAFLGLPRSEKTAAAHEAPWQINGPMTLLGICCLSIGLLPQLAARLIQPAIGSAFPALAGGTDLSLLAPFQWMQAVSCALIAAAAILALILVRRLKNGQTAQSCTWGCGYLQPTPRIQYTSTSFAEMLVDRFRTMLRPHHTTVRLKGVLPPMASFGSRIPETVLDALVLPCMRLTGIGFSYIRRLQHGQQNLYVLYIFVTLFLLLIWAR